MKFESRLDKKLPKYVTDETKNLGNLQISGPYGAGLGLSTRSAGAHLAIVEGEGILPFLDLVAYLIRRMIAQDTPEMPFCRGERFDDLHPDFELVLYAWYPKRADGMGLELCEAAARMSSSRQRRGGI